MSCLDDIQEVLLRMMTPLSAFTISIKLDFFRSMKIIRGYSLSWSICTACFYPKGAELRHTNVAVVGYVYIKSSKAGKTLPISTLKV